MKKIISLSTALLLSAIMIVPVMADGETLRYIAGRVQSINNFSRTGLLHISANVPTVDYSIEHQIAGLAYVQNCPPGEECIDIAYEVFSDWSSEGAVIYKVDQSHGNHARNPHVVGYR